MNTNMSLFSQLLTIVNRHQFQRSVQLYDMDKGCKGFNTWQLFVSMLFCHLGQAKSLREICDGLKSAEGKLSHLGMSYAPSKSNLAYANANRPWQFYQHVFHAVLEKCYKLSPGKKTHFKFHNKLYSLDATIIDLCLSLFPWSSFRYTKGAVKIHLLLDHDGYFPAFAHITEARVNELKIANALNLPKGSIIALDRGYADYGLFNKWTEEGVFFVTRLKEGAAFNVLARSKDKSRNIRADWKVGWKGFVSRKNCPAPLRVVKFWDQEKKELLAFLTNIFHLSASTIAAIYKDRWEIELFFKALKQNLRVKTFVGTSPNALRVQIWTALIAILLLKYLQHCSHVAWSLSNLAALLRMNLMAHIELREWLDRKWAEPHLRRDTGQMLLNLGQHQQFS